MSDDHAKYGKAFLGKLLTVIAIPALVYYCVTRPDEKAKQDQEDAFREKYEDKPVFTPHDPFKNQRDEWQQSIPTQIPRDSFQ